jgi:circadian clock protein KaiB
VARQPGTAGPAPEPFELKLYVAGQTPKSLAAISNLHAICESRPAGSYSVTVVDLLEQPQLARADQIIALPTLVRTLPAPSRRIIGDLSDAARVLVTLGLVER